MILKKHIKFTLSCYWIFVIDSNYEYQKYLTFFNWVRFYFPSHDIIVISSLFNQQYKGDTYLTYKTLQDVSADIISNSFLIFLNTCNSISDHKIRYRTLSTWTFRGEMGSKYIRKKIPLYVDDSVSGRMLSFFKWLGISDHMLYQIKQSINPYFDTNDCLLEEQVEENKLNAFVFMGRSLNSDVVMHIRGRCLNVEYFLNSVCLFLKHLFRAESAVYIILSDKIITRWISGLISKMVYVFPGKNRVFIASTFFDVEHGLNI